MTYSMKTFVSFLALLFASKKDLGSFSFHHRSISSYSSTQVITSTVIPRLPTNNSGGSIFAHSATSSSTSSSSSSSSSSSLLSPASNLSPASAAMIGSLRGGSIAIASTAAALLQNGRYGSGILALTLIASAVVTPLTLYRQGYSFSVGYGFSVGAMGLALLNTFWGDSLVSSAFALADATNHIGSATDFASCLMRSSPILLVASVIFYGFRLGSFLLLREWTVSSKQKQIKSFDKIPPLQIIPLAISVSMFYAFMVTPVLYSCRKLATISAAATSAAELPLSSSLIAFGGAAIAWFGALLEAVADGQKFLTKRGKDGSKDFVGPTNGVFKISRHPNYLGEILFWFGILLSGIPSFGKSIPGWICSTLGFVGIYKIMTGATDRLEKRHEENYGSQKLYNQWKENVPGKLFPHGATIVQSFPPTIVLLVGTAFTIKLIELICKLL